VSHRDTVADGYGIELEWDAARIANRLFDNLGHPVEMDVAGDDFAETVGNGDKWLVNIGVSDTAGVQQGAMRRMLKTAFY
jgi:hypothetical protein